jgi:hypothetical protein
MNNSFSVRAPISMLVRRWSRQLPVLVRRGFAVALLCSLCGCATPKPNYSYQPQHPLRVIADVRPQAVLPDLAKWRALKIGMTEAEVTTLLGKPITKDPRPPADTDPSITHVYRWHYGEIIFHSFNTQGTFYYSVVFHEGRVRDICDPWNGSFSTNGSPTLPELILPEAEKTLDYYPRFMDFRWQPSSGIYPIDYEVTIQVLADSNRELGESDGLSQTEMHEPAAKPDSQIQREQVVLETYRYRTHDIYLPLTWLGMGPGRWRVRAVNDLGASDWSAWRYFKFSK